MGFPDVIFKRKFSMSMYKNLKLPLGEMTFTKDFVTDTCGDLYPVLEKSGDCREKVEDNRYLVESGSVKRLLGQFFPYATYELSAACGDGGKAGFCFRIPGTEACIFMEGNDLIFTCAGHRQCGPRQPDDLPSAAFRTMILTCRPGAFDIYFKKNGQAKYWHTFHAPEFEHSNEYAAFSNGYAGLYASGKTVISQAVCYMDNGVSQADLRPIRYENSEVMMEQGQIYLSGSIRFQEGACQGIFAWVPGTAKLELTGVLFFDAGDGVWAGDVASSILYHRAEKRWYLWVCSFSHKHILGHSAFEGDPRFGVNVADIRLMEKGPEDVPISAFCGQEGDEDPDFFYDEERKEWSMAICRMDHSIHGYRYVFFRSQAPFEGYRCIGQGADGEETGGSFVRIGGELFFLCGNGFGLTSNYRIYSKDGMKNAVFDYPDGGFRGWGTLIPVKMGGRVRYFWLTFDRHKGSDYNWSYGNLYCFEADI